MLSVVLPGLSLGCQQKFNRKVALYFVAPFGMLAGALGYPQHECPAVVAGILGGAASVVLASTWSPIAPHRLAFNLGGCALMLGSQYVGDQIAKDRARHEGPDCSEHRS